MPEPRQPTQLRDYAPIWRLTYASASGQPIECRINYALADQVTWERAVRAAREVAA
jgi:hypothetical protein